MIAVAMDDLRLFCPHCTRVLKNAEDKDRLADTVTGDHDLRTDEITLTHDQCGALVALSKRTVK